MLFMHLKILHSEGSTALPEQNYIWILLMACPQEKKLELEFGSQYY